MSPRLRSRCPPGARLGANRIEADAGGRKGTGRASTRSQVSCSCEDGGWEGEGRSETKAGRIGRRLRIKHKASSAACYCRKRKGQCCLTNRYAKAKTEEAPLCLLGTVASPRQCRRQAVFDLSDGLSSTRGVTSTVCGFLTSAPPGIGSNQRKQNGSPNTITRPSYRVCSESS